MELPNPSTADARSDVVEVLPAPADGIVDGHWPIVKLQAIGDGEAVTKTLVRVLVRRALISAGIIPSSEDCEIQTPAG
jgi:hypothetical protein